MSLVTRPVITSCDIDVVVVCYRTLSGVMIVCSWRAFVIPYIWGLNRDERVLQLVVWFMFWFLVLVFWFHWFVVLALDGIGLLRC